MDRINQTRPPMDDDEDDGPLTADQVRFVFPEAGNENYIRKYQMHLGTSTLRNMRSAAEEGIAFMNSHRTGSMSTACELPYGRTFAGRMEILQNDQGQRRSRVLMAAYMIRGVKPNGDSGPSTDDLYKMVKGGTLSDVSVGFIDQGTAVCDVCGEDMDRLDEDGYAFVCPHLPGTHRSMSAEQVQAQKDKGVPDGVCTFTFENGQVNEVSAIYDGALPGAGFRKAMKLARRQELTATELEEATRSFAPILNGRPLADPFPDRPHRRPPTIHLSHQRSTSPPVTMPETTQDGGGPTNPNDEGTTMPSLKLAQVLMALGQSVDDQGNVDTDTLASQLSSGGSANGSKTPKPQAGQTPPAPPAPTPPPAPAPALTNSPQLTSEQLRIQELERQLSDEKARNSRVEHQARMDAVALEAETYADSQIRFGRVTAAERGELITLYRTAASDDAQHPTSVTFRDPKSNQPTQGTRLAALKATVERRPMSSTGSQTVNTSPDQRQQAMTTLDNGTGDGDTFQNSIKDMALSFAKRGLKKKTQRV